MDERLIGLVVFPGFAALDIVGPYEVLASLGPNGLQAGYRTVWVAENLMPVKAHQGMVVVADLSFDEARDLDVVVIPGGPGYLEEMENPKMMQFLASAAGRASWMTSVCTGALILAKAGLLTGKRATTHWMTLSELSLYGATPVKQRVVTEKGIITAAGVSAGIDMALSLAAELAGEAAAKVIQLNIEYDPQPPFDSGSPDKASPETLAAFTAAADQ